MHSKHTASTAKARRRPYAADLAAAIAWRLRLVLLLPATCLLLLLLCGILCHYAMTTSSY